MTHLRTWHGNGSTLLALQPLLLLSLLLLLLELCAALTNASNATTNAEIDTNNVMDTNSTARGIKETTHEVKLRSHAHVHAPAHGQARARSSSLVSHTDEYIARNQKQCFETRSLVSCVKYKASKLIWKLATNGLGYFPNEYGRELNENVAGASATRERRVRLIQLGEPADNIEVFNDAKSLAGDNELTHILKFFKRAAETFGRNHGLQLALSSETGVHIVSDVEARNRNERKRRKWLIVLPLIILMKIAHLKMTLVTLLLGVWGFNVLLVGGVGWLIHYLKYKTLCKIHPHLVQTHSHVYDSDPTDYSQFLGSSFSGGVPYYGSGGTSGGPHEINANSYNKDWATSKAYHGHNYLDTISKRIK